MASSRRRFLLSAVAVGGASIARRTAADTGPAAAGETTNVAAANEQTENAFAYRRNWGRWGANDQMGAVNLITPPKRAAAARLVKTGRTAPG